MRFRLGCFSINGVRSRRFAPLLGSLFAATPLDRYPSRRGTIALFVNPAIANINPADYQLPPDRYRNGKPIIRISGAVAKGTIPIERINEDFVNNPRRRTAILQKFNTSGGLTLDTRQPRTPRKTKAKPSRTRTRKAVRVQRKNGSTFIRIQNVTTPPPPNTPNPKPRQVIATLPRPRSSGRAALMSLSGIAGVAGAMYLLDRQRERDKG